jgi:hypothetical protein
MTTPTPSWVPGVDDVCWLPVVGYEGFYEVSRCERVRSVERVVEKVNPWEGTVSKFRLPAVELKPFMAKSGHPRVALYRGSIRRNVSVRRLTTQAFGVWAA